MELRELRPGLWRWTAFHPEWKEDVGSVAAVRRRAPTTEAFRLGEPLPAGVEAFATARSSEVVYWLPAHRSLVPGDVLLGAAGGGVRLCRRGWLPEAKMVPQLAASLRPLLDLPVSRVLVSHGEPVLRNGRAALERALAP